MSETTDTQTSPTHRAQNFQTSACRAIHVQELRSMIEKHLSLYDTINLLTYGPNLRHELENNITHTVKHFLSLFGNKHDLYNLIKACDLCIFDQSAYLLIFRKPVWWIAVKTLYLLCYEEQFHNTRVKLDALGFKPTASDPRRSTHHIEHYEGVKTNILYRSNSADICLVVANTRCRTSLVLSSTSTAFMNYLSIDRIWSAYPEWSRKAVSLQHPHIQLSYNRRHSFDIRMRNRAEALCLITGIREHAGIQRMPLLSNLSQQSGKIEDDFRHSDDESTLTVTLHNYLPTTSGPSDQVKKSWIDYRVKWFLGGEYEIGNEMAFLHSFTRRSK